MPGEQLALKERHRNLTIPGYIPVELLVVDRTNRIYH